MCLLETTNKDVQKTVLLLQFFRALAHLRLRNTVVYKPKWCLCYFQNGFVKHILVNRFGYRFHVRSHYSILILQVGYVEYNNFQQQTWYGVILRIKLYVALPAGESLSTPRISAA